MSTGGRRTIAIDQTQARLDSTAVDAALAVLDRFMAALNAGDEPALLATLHFPHYRLAGGRVQVQFTRYRADDSVIGSFRSLWIVTKEGDRWAVAARSSFAD